MRLDYHYVVIAVNISELCKKKKKNSCTIIIVILDYNFHVQRTASGIN